MSNVRRNVRRVDWNDVVVDNDMVQTMVDFSLGIMSGRAFVSSSNFLGYGTLARNLLRNRTVPKAREVVRKMLKRRQILNRHNVVNTMVYGL